MYKNELSKRRVKVTPTPNLKHPKRKPRKPTVTNDIPVRRICLPGSDSRCKHKRTTVDGHISVCTLCGEITSEEMVSQPEEGYGTTHVANPANITYHPNNPHKYSDSTPSIPQVHPNPSSDGVTQPKGKVSTRDTIEGEVSLTGGHTGVCTHKFIRGTRSGTVCGANTRDRMVTECYKHRLNVEKAKPKKISTTCGHTFAYGGKKGTVCGMTTSKGLDRCCKHKPKKV